MNIVGASNRTDTEEEIIRRHKTDVLYNHEFEKGRFFQVVHEDSDGFTVKLAPRTMLKAVYIKENDDIEGIEIIKLIDEKEKQKVVLSKFNFAQLRAFLTFISEIDLKGITEKRIKLIQEDELDAETIRKVNTLLSKEGGEDVVINLINSGIITSKDIVNTSFRKRGLKIFKSMISMEAYWKTYASDNSIISLKEESVWQYFFQKNEWIFGYGLDYRYLQILEKEAHISDSDIDGKNEVITDFLLGDKKFTTFVEIKKPTTPLFSNRMNRANSWGLSTELMYAVSQILEQKASGLIKLDSEGFDSHGNAIKQKAYDSKVILIIGNWREIESCSEREQKIKRKTFELFRRDSRNIEILTFDELYDRAKFIVEGNTKS